MGDSNIFICPVVLGGGVCFDFFGGLWVFFGVCLLCFVLSNLLDTSRVSDSFQEGNFLVLRLDALEVIVGVKGPIPRCFVKIASGICRAVMVAKLKS